MAWFRKDRRAKQPVGDRDVEVPEGLWTKCNSCREIVYRNEILRNFSVCPKCDHHFRISAPQRLGLLCDDGIWTAFATGLAPVDSLRFRDTQRYKDRLETYQQKIGLKDAIVAAEGNIEGMPVVLAVMEYGFMGGSMGSVVGETITRAAERALERHRPLLVVSCSGGARMQEGAQSLMQMAKISAALARLDVAGIPFLSILTDPTTGGVTASFAMLGDVNVAEPQALIGFAGPRVIEQTIREKLPAGFQRSEFLLQHGMLDLVVHRAELKATVARLLRHLSPTPVDRVLGAPALSESARS